MHPGCDVICAVTRPRELVEPDPGRIRRRLSAGPTFGAGGELRFALSQPMARAMLATLQAHLDEAAVSGIVGFGA